MSQADQSSQSVPEYFRVLRTEIVEAQKLRVQVGLAKIVFLGTLLSYFLKDHKGDASILICPFVALMFDFMVYGLSFNIRDVGDYIGEYLEPEMRFRSVSRDFQFWQIHRKLRAARFRDWGRIMYRAGSYGISFLAATVSFRQAKQATSPPSSWVLLVLAIVAAFGWCALIRLEFVKKRAPHKRRKNNVGFVLLPKQSAADDGERLGWENKLGIADNNGRKVCARGLRGPEYEIRHPDWRPPAVLLTGDTGFQVATFSEFSRQDRHKHESGAEIYTVLKGEMEIFLNDEGPHRLLAGDEIIIPPGTIHEILQKRHDCRHEGEEFALLARVHAFPCGGDRDKFVQLTLGGEWFRWDRLSAEERVAAYRKQVAEATAGGALT